MWVARAPAGRAGLPRSAAAPNGKTLPSLPTIQYPDAEVLPGEVSALAWGAVWASGRTAATATARAAAIRRPIRVVRGVASEFKGDLSGRHASGPRCGANRSGAPGRVGQLGVECGCEDDGTGRRVVS